VPGITLATFSCGELKKIKTCTELPGAIKKEKVMTYGLKEDVKKAKEESKKADNKFFNALLNICVINAVVDWEDKDPQKEFKELGRLLIVYMKASGIKVDK
jgi:hypothetical protein